MFRLAILSVLLTGCVCSAQEAAAPDSAPAGALSAATFQGLRFRLIGPAISSGRVTSFAVHPRNRAHYYVGVASGGVWKTTNGGATFTPVFDNEGSYSIGTVVLDPKNPDTVWVGTGENNSQRSVGYGDGVYRSDDGGRTWKNVGLKASEHIGRIAIDPRGSNVVYVAAQGPLWGPGGDRGLYKTTDGGKNWKKILEIGENTGVTDVALDPANPDVLLAAAYQRRRHVWTLINGGPESALYKSRDGGATWTKLRTGLPGEEMGRIGLAVSPARQGLVYARIEAANKAGGVFRSADFGESWEKRNPLDPLAMYYGQIVADPSEADRVYVMETIARVSDDGGRAFRPVGDRAKHIDTHTFWIDPANSEYILAGCDGGVYESFDRGRTWLFKANLPTMQFYDVTTDNSTPFYYVYGGTQDNWSLGGPSRTRNATGIVNSDWFVTNGGDGFVTRVDPEDPNIVYSESQYGGLVRYDRRTGERLGIQPLEGRDEPPLRWNWDAPLIISPHRNTRLYFAANKVFRSDDRGGSWKAVSPDLTRQTDRNTLPVMGRLWGPDAVAKSNSTSFYGNITALAESPKQEGLLYAGTDDGLIQVSENGGGSWRGIGNFPGVPERAYVARLAASRHEAGTVYAAFENHKNADFKPYLLKSANRGATWASAAGDLPANGPVLAFAEDHVDSNLLFVGTEFGLYFTVDGGRKWIRLKGDLPTIAVRDLAIQERENDLVAGTFGRGIYILDDYTPLRALAGGALEREAFLFPVKPALQYVESQPWGGRGKAWQGEGFYAAENPPYGAVFTYHLKDTLKTRKQRRQEAEKEAARKKETPPYPPPAELSREAGEEPPAIVLTVKDSAGRVVRQVAGPVTKGMHRVSWNLRCPPPVPPPASAAGEGDEDSPRRAPGGHFALPGQYTVSLARRVDGVTTPLGLEQKFTVRADPLSASSPADREALFEFQQQVSRLQRAVAGAVETANSARARLAAIKRAIEESAAPAALRDRAAALDAQVARILTALRGDEALRARQENLPTSIEERIVSIAGDQRMSTAPPTQTHRASYQAAAAGFAAGLARLRALVETDLKKLESELEAAGVPHTPGRIPEWKEK